MVELTTGIQYIFLRNFFDFQLDLHSCRGLSTSPSVEQTCSEDLVIF